MMRPFTRAVFEKEGKAIVGSRWTLKQVQQAYEKADDLLDYIVECKKLKHVKHKGFAQAHLGFVAGLEDRVVEDVTDKRVQSLSLRVLRELLDRGVAAMVRAVHMYRDAPESFKARYAASHPAFFKDKFLQRDVPVDSFAPFNTGENPAMTQNKKLSQMCANLYQDSDSFGYSAGWLFFSDGGYNVFQETTLIQEVVQTICQNRLGEKDHVLSVLPIRNKRR